MKSFVPVALVFGLVVAMTGCNSHKNEPPKSLNEKLPPPPQGGGGSFTKENKSNQPLGVEK